MPGYMYSKPKKKKPTAKKKVVGYSKPARKKKKM